MAGISEKDTNIYLERLISSLVENNILVAKMTLRKILSLPNNGFKIIRRFYQLTFSGGWRLNDIIRQTTISKSWYSTLMQITILEQFTKLLAEYDKQGMVKKGKILTLSKMPKFLLTVEPEVMAYLFNEGRLTTGKQFKFSGFSYEAAPSESFTNVILTEANNTEPKIFAALGFNIAKLSSPGFIKINYLTKIIDNLIFLLNNYGEKYPNLADETIHLLTSEFIACNLNKLNIREDGLYIDFSHMRYGRSPEEIYEIKKYCIPRKDLEQLMIPMKKKIADALSDIIAKEVEINDAASVLKKHNINLKTITVYTDDVDEAMKEALNGINAEESSESE